MNKSTPSTSLLIGIAALATALAFVEHGYAPWRPFYVVYAALCIALPLLFRTIDLGSARLGIVGWLAVLALPFAMQFAAGQWLNLLWPGLLGLAGVSAEAASTAFYSIGAALPGRIAQYADARDMEVQQLLILYVGFITLWAGIGEEFFYRGFLYAGLRARGIVFATLVSNGFFAARHLVQLQGPDYPWGAAVSWLIMSFALGLVFTWLYEWKKSVWPAAIAHTLFNVIPFAQMLAALRG